MLALEKYLAQCSLEENLLHLVKLRVSQINGCAFCLDKHWKDLRAIGENEQRLCSLNAWRECPYYTDRERAALAWAEALTLITQGHASDTVYAEASAYLSEQELSDLTAPSPPSTPGTGSPSPPAPSQAPTNPSESTKPSTPSSPEDP